MMKQQIYKFDSGEKIFFTSDTHFHHVNIMKYCNRPFNTIEEHDEEIIKRWNEKVPKDGLVFHLGDVFFQSYTYAIDILQRLNGNKILIIGNHDWKNLINKIDKVYHNKTLNDCFINITQQLFIEIEGQKIYLNHFPFLCMNGVYGNDNLIWQLYGHVHTSPYSDTGLDMPRLKMCFPQQYDVGVDNNNFTPVSFNELKTIINNRKAQV